MLVSMASLAQSTQNNKFAKSLQYLKKEVRDKVDFCRDKQLCNIFAMYQASSKR